MPDINATLQATLKSTEKSMANLDQTIDKLASSLAVLVKQSGSTATTIGEYHQATQELEDAAAGEILQRTKSTKLTEHQLKIQKDLAAAMADEARARKDIKKYEKALTKASGEERIKLENKLRGANAALVTSQGKQRDLLKSTGLSLGSFIKGLNLVGVVLTWLAGLIVGEYKRQKEVIKTTSGMIDLGESFTDGRIKLERMAFVAGLNYDEMMKNITANRQAVNAMGGTSAAMETWTTDVRNSFMAMTGDVDEAFQMYVESQTLLRKNGVIPTVSAMKNYALDTQKLASLTGMASGEIAALYQEVAQDTDSMVLLRAAREGEREAILASQRALINQSVAAGMSAEQAKEAAKMLNKMVAAKPLERMKQAARIRALGAAMGIGGAEAAAAGVLAGPRATGEQREAVMTFSKAAATFTDQMRGAGLGQEIFATTLLEKLDLEQYYGSGSNFSMSLTEALRNQAGEFRNILDDSALGKMATLQENWNRMTAVSAGQGVGLLEMINNLIDKIYNFLKGGSLGKLMEKTSEGVKGWLAVARGEKARLEAQTAEREKFMKEKRLERFLKPEEQERIRRQMEQTTPAEITTPAGQQKVTTETAKREEARRKTDLETARQQVQELKSTRGGIETQLKSMQSTNDILLRIHANSEKQVELAERQLVATLLTEKEKTSPGGRAAFIAGNRFVSQYGGLGGLA